MSAPVPVHRTQASAEAEAQRQADARGRPWRVWSARNCAEHGEAFYVTPATHEFPACCGMRAHYPDFHPRRPHA